MTADVGKQLRAAAKLLAETITLKKGLRSVKHTDIPPDFQVSKHVAVLTRLFKKLNLKVLLKDPPSFSMSRGSKRYGIAFGFSKFNFERGTWEKLISTIKGYVKKHPEFKSVISYGEGKGVVVFNLHFRSVGDQEGKEEEPFESGPAAP